MNNMGKTWKKAIRGCKRLRQDSHLSCVVEWPCQNPDLYPTGDLCKDLKLMFTDSFIQSH